MQFNSINTRADLDALAGTPEHDAFLAALGGSLWRLEKDDTAGVWRAVADSTTVKRFGFTSADFPKALPPALPAYVAPPVGEDILREIAALEQTTMLPRVTREFMLGFMEANATPAQLAANVGYTKVKALDGQIKALRIKL